MSSRFAALALIVTVDGCCARPLDGHVELLTRPPSDELRNRRRSLSRHRLHSALLDAVHVAGLVGDEPWGATAATPPTSSLPSSGDGALVASRSATVNGSKSTPEPTLLLRCGDHMAPAPLAMTGDCGDGVTLPPSSSPGGGFNGRILGLSSAVYLGLGFKGLILPSSSALGAWKEKEMRKLSAPS
uniref:Uncharacterized protein n=1 Tax=Zea mays TaxID=4577 RepID=A0A804NR84_MAIZE